MIVNHTTYRTPRVLTKQEFNSCKTYVEKEIVNYLKSTGTKEFVVKDIFGYDNWDWSKQHPAINVIFDEWASYYAKKYGSKWTNDEVWAEAYKQAGISLGHIVKQACRDIQQYKFKVSNPSYWNLTYKVI